jgi:excisionase family DNA binding protein
MNHLPGSHRLLDIQQAADHLGRNVAYLRRLVARRELPHFKIGGALRFAVQDLDSFLVACRVEAWK